MVKYLLAGADVVMTASALIRHGPGHAAVLLDGLSGWMARKGYPSVAGVRGMLALPADTDQPAYEREGYVRDASRQHLPRSVVTPGYARSTVRSRKWVAQEMHGS